MVTANGKPKARRRKSPSVPLRDGKPQPISKALKVAIVGKAPSSMQLAPFDDESWEIWTLNDTNYRKLVPRWSRHFELHDIEKTKDKRYDDYFPWLQKKHNKPVYVRENWDEAKHCTRYPYEQIFAEFNRRYFTNTISYMIALAITEGAKEIGLWGVDMAQHGSGWKSEYANQRPSCEYFVGIAEGRGVKVHIPDQSDLLKANHLYGFEQGEMATKFDARLKELQDRIKQHEIAEEQNHDAARYLRGAYDNMQEWIKQLI